MTSQPPPGGYDPAQGQQPYGQPYGQQPYGQQPYGVPGQPYGAPAGRPGGWNAPPPVPPASARRRPRVVDWVLLGGAALYLLFALLPWMSSDESPVSVNGFDSSVSSEFFGFPFAVSIGYSSALVVCAWVLLVLAAVWALLPALGKGHVVQVSFPREGVAVLLTGLAFVLTFTTWVQTLTLDGQVAEGLDGGSFSVMAFLTLLTSLALLVAAVLSLLPALRNRAKVPGAVTGAAQWVNRPGPAFGPPGQAGPPPTGPQEPWQQGSWQQPPSPQPYGQPLPPPPPAQTPPPEGPPQGPPPGTGGSGG